MVIHSARSQSCRYNLNGKETAGSALVSPCWRPGIWPAFEDQSCNFLCFCRFSLWLFGKTGSDE